MEGKSKPMTDGQAVFSGLDLGVYFGMVTDVPAELEVMPFIVTIPARNPETKVMEFNREVTVKDGWYTSSTVKKAWEDKEDQDGIRPTFITVTLSNGKTVKLNADNGWQHTEEHLPMYAGGQEIKYTWSEAKVDGYTATQVTEGNVTTITNTLWQLVPPPDNIKPGPRPGVPEDEIDDYGTPLGLGIIINHVGDCFD